MIGFCLAMMGISLAIPDIAVLFHKPSGGGGGTTGQSIGLLLALTKAS